MGTNSWWQYVDSRTTAETQVEMARESGIEQTSLSRWKSGDAPHPSKVIAFARNMHRPPVEALIASGHLTPEEVRRHVTISTYMDPADLTDYELVAELTRRLEAAVKPPELIREESTQGAGGHRLFQEPQIRGRREALGESLKYSAENKKVRRHKSLDR